RAAILGLRGLENKLSLSDWRPDSLFGAGGQSALRDLVGVMMRIPQLEKQLRDLGGHSGQQRRIAEITYSWVTGASIEQIARAYFGATPDRREKFTQAISRACVAIYRTLTNYGSWGLASLAKMPTSGLDFEKMTDDERKRINNLAAMVYYGVRTNSAILMRMESVPRSIAEPLGEVFVKHGGRVDEPDSPRQVRRFIKSLGLADWQNVVPSGATMSGADYRQVWSWLSGEETQ
ncbi:MAG: DEAD/DEAH box helicase, partial [Acidobacteria bacterium]|nr:DEAD/DEAH box helicase [Acidobacteriota bacterium]